MKLSYVSLKKKISYISGKIYSKPCYIQNTVKHLQWNVLQKMAPDTLSKPKPKNQKDPPKNKFPIFREKELSDSKIKKNYIFPEMEPCTIQPKLEK